MFDGNDLPHELLLTTRQKAQLRNAFDNNMQVDTKLSKAQISKIIQSGGFLGSLLSKLAGTLMKVAVHPALRRRGDVGTTSLCTSQLRGRYVPNQEPNDILMERRQDVSVVCLHEVLLERRNNVSKECNNDVPSVCSKSQMKHQTTSQWYVAKTSQWYVSTTSH